MFADPQTVTVNSVAKSLARVGNTNPGRAGSFRTADGEYLFEVRQNSTANRFRREVRLTHVKVAADPISAVNKEVSASIIFAVDEPRWGFSDADLKLDIAGLVAWWTASSAARQDQLLAGEL